VSRTIATVDGGTKGEEIGRFCDGDGRIIMVAMASTFVNI